MSGTEYVIDQLGDALRNSHNVIAEQAREIEALRTQVAGLTRGVDPGEEP